MVGISELPPSVTPVNDNGGSLTVDNSIISVVGTGTEAAAQRVTIATDSTGVLSVDDNGGALTVDNGGTFAVQIDGASLTALQKIDDPVLVDDAAFTPAASSVSMAGFTFDDVAPDSVNEGDAGAARMSANRNVYTTIRDAAGNERGVNVNASSQLSVSVDNSVTVSSHAVTNAGTFPVQVDGAALTALQKIDDPVLVDDAGFTPATSSVMMAGYQFDDAATDSVDEGDAGAARMSANRNQYVQLRDAAGNERGANINASNQLAVTGPVTNAGVFAVQVDGAALTSLQLIDDPVIADDAGFTPATSKVMMAGFEADEAAVDSVDEGDAGAARMSLNRNQYVQIRDGASNERGATVNASNQLSVTGPVTNAGVFAVQDSEKLADNAGFTDGTTKVDAAGYIYDEVAGTALTENDIAAARINLNRAQVGIIEDGATRGRWATVNASNALKVDGSAVTQPVSGTVTASNTAGDVAHDTGDSGNPVKIGAKAVSAEPAVVTANDRVNLIADLVGKLITLPYSNPENFVSGVITSAMTGTTSTSLVAAPASGLRNYLTTITVSNAHATVGTDMIVQDGNGGTTIWTIPAAAVYGGASITFPVPLRQPTTATAIYIANVTTGASTKASACGYKGV